MVSLAVDGRTAQAARGPPAAQAASAQSSASWNTDLDSLNHSEWRFVELDGVSTPASVHATLRFCATYMPSGKAGCNAYGALPHRRGRDGQLHANPFHQDGLPATRRRDGVAQGVFNAFRNTAKVVIVNGELVMLEAAGKPLAKLKQQMP